MTTAWLSVSRDPEWGGGVARGATALARTGGFHTVFVGRRPGERWPRLGDARRVREAPGDAVLVHTSLRHRALLRDAALTRRESRPVLLWFHGTDRRLATGAPTGFLRALFGSRRAIASTAEQVPWLERLGLEVVGVSPIGWDSERLRGLVPRPEPRTVLFAGRATVAKGLDRLVAAAAPDFRLLVAGEGPVAGGQRLGFVDGEAWRTAHGRAQLFALPSRDEGAPVSLLEALGAGLPALVTDVGAMASLVGDAGWVVPKDVNPVELGGFLRAAFADADELAWRAAAAPERAAPFTAERVARWFLAL